MIDGEWYSSDMISNDLYGSYWGLFVARLFVSFTKALWCTRNTNVIYIMMMDVTQMFTYTQTFGPLDGQRTDFSVYLSVRQTWDEWFTDQETQKTERFVLTLKDTTNATNTWEAVCLSFMLKRCLLGIFRWGDVCFITWICMKVDLVHIYTCWGGLMFDLLLSISSLGSHWNCIN